MSDIVIENPILNSPYREPTRHFKFDEDGITNEIAATRRASAYFIPVPASKKKKGSQLGLYQTEWTQDRIQPNDLVNEIRPRIAIWRQGGYAGVTGVTRRLLEYWTDPDREKKLFFCQIEALETVIYITEVAKRYGDTWVENRLRTENEQFNAGLFRLALKMATGTGKTVVMAMLVAWHALNKLANAQDARFADAFLIITPGITIRDRLRVLLPSDPGNYYRQRDILPSYLLEELGKAQIVITNYHAFLPRETQQASKLTKTILRNSETSAFTETPDQVVRRVCRDLGKKKNIVILNDEAHHCYQPKPAEEQEKLTGEDRKEAEKREKEARVWFTGLTWVKQKLGVRAIYDLSATPFFLRGSGYPEGTLFPWVVSDFSLIDAIESGIVKIPRVPVWDNTLGEEPAFKHLWPLISDELPKGGLKKTAIAGEPKLPSLLENALHTLYSDYEVDYRAWQADEIGRQNGRMPPVFIIVCSNTAVSKLVYDYVAGWVKTVGDKEIVQAGKLDIFRNDDSAGGWLHRPNTLLIDSEQLESGEQMSDEFKQIALAEIEEFKAEYEQRFQGRDASKLTDEDLLREVMNTVGKPGKLGEHIKCVISVSMLTEGWDVNSVTHVLGIRAFGTMLLSEQVVGRALRRMSYDADETGMFAPEYADVYGVPFSFLPTAEKKVKDTTHTPVVVTRVRALPERAAAEITFPKLQGYRYEIPAERIEARFSPDTYLVLSTKDMPTATEVGAIVGESALHTAEDLKRKRPNQVAFTLAELALRKLRDDDGNDRPWLFPQVLAITKRWMEECVVLKDDTYLQLLLLMDVAHNAAAKIYQSIVQAAPEQPVLKPILRPYENTGSTAVVDFDTTRPVFLTHFEKCHVSHCVLDSGWEKHLAEKLEDMQDVVRYVKNYGMGFTIPYTLDGDNRQYVPDYIVCIADGHGRDDPLNLIIEVTGERKRDKVEKVNTARNLWVTAVNNDGRFGRWAFMEITDPWNAVNDIRGFVRSWNHRA